MKILGLIYLLLISSFQLTAQSYDWKTWTPPGVYDERFEALLHPPVGQQSDSLMEEPIWQTFPYEIPKVGKRGSIITHGKNISEVGYSKLTAYLMSNRIYEIDMKNDAIDYILGLYPTSEDNNALFDWLRDKKKNAKDEEFWFQDDQRRLVLATVSSNKLNLRWSYAGGYKPEGRDFREGLSVEYFRTLPRYVYKKDAGMEKLHDFFIFPGFEYGRRYTLEELKIIFPEFIPGLPIRQISEDRVTYGGPEPYYNQDEFEIILQHGNIVEIRIKSAEAALWLASQTKGEHFLWLEDILRRRASVQDVNKHYLEGEPIRNDISFYLFKTNFHELYPTYVTFYVNHHRYQIEINFGEYDNQAKWAMDNGPEEQREAARKIH